LRVLVTGATGFVGRALVPALEQHGMDVRPALRWLHNRFSGGYVVGEVGPQTDWKKALQDVDIVVHLAARVHVLQESSADPLVEFRRTNTAGTERLAHQSAAAGVKRLVYVSTIKVNGEETFGEERFTAEDIPSPSDPYAVSKWEAESALRRISRDTGMEVVIVRPPLVYGPGVRGNLALLARWISKGIPLPLGRVTTNRRTLIGIDNLTDLLVMCAIKEEAANRVFLAGDSEDLSTVDLLRLIGRALGRRPRLLPVPTPIVKGAGALLGKQDIVRRLCGSLRVDNSYARRVLGWEPGVPVEEGMIRAFRGVFG